MAACGEAAQRDALELPAGTTLAAVPTKGDVTIPMLYDQTLKALQRALALHDPVALPPTTGEEGDVADVAATPALLTALATLRPPGTPAQLPLDGDELRDDALPQDLQIAYHALRTLAPADTETALALPYMYGAYGGLWLTTARQMRKVGDRRLLDQPKIEHYWPWTSRRVFTGCRASPLCLCLSLQYTSALVYSLYSISYHLSVCAPCVVRRSRTVRSGATQGP